MAVTGSREIIPRTLSHRFGEKPSAVRNWSVTTDGATSHADVVAATGEVMLAGHPEYGFLKLTEFAINEVDVFHVEVQLTYTVPPEAEKNPLARADIWHFSTGGTSVVGTEYYFGEGNATKKGLKNTAGDVYEGIMIPEGETRATITGNRQLFPLGDARAVTNSVNDRSWAGCAIHTWFCSGISGEYTSEMVDAAEVEYWKITVELIFRSSNHNLFLPNVGFHYIKPGTPPQRMRAYVRSLSDPLDTGSEVIAVPCTLPVSLKEDGDINDVIDQSPEARGPLIKEFRVYREFDFSTVFGNPPASVTVLGNL
jgi:hypothetical protein